MVCSVGRLRLNKGAFSEPSLIRVLRGRKKNQTTGVRQQRGRRPPCCRPVPGSHVVVREGGTGRERDWRASLPGGPAQGMVRLASAPATSKRGDGLDGG